MVRLDLAQDYSTEPRGFHDSSKVRPYPHSQSEFVTDGRDVDLLAPHVNTRVIAESGDANLGFEALWARGYPCWR